MNQKPTRNNTQYTFGTSSVAAARLEDIAGVFNPLAAEFIRPFVPEPRDTAMDLGCGPGFTTNMLAGAVGCATTYGLDSSPEFLEMARRRFSDCVFLEHDVTKAPFPVMVDVMYARFLLCHLRNPLDVIDLWITQLNPGGLLFLEEIDSIDTAVDVFKTYLAVNEGLIASEGASLYVGQAMATVNYRADVLLNAVAVLPVANHQAASWFFPNTRTIWRESDYVKERLSPEERENVGRELARLKEKEDSRSDITWRLRRFVLSRQTG
jgi:SAM-dependent methyltransferase